MKLTAKPAAERIPVEPATRQKAELTTRRIPTSTRKAPNDRKTPSSCKTPSNLKVPSRCKAPDNRKAPGNLRNQKRSALHDYQDFLA